MLRGMQHNSVSTLSCYERDTNRLIVTKLRLDEIMIVWCHVCAMNVSIHYCYGNRERDQDGDSMMKVYAWSLMVQ